MLSLAITLEQKNVSMQTDPVKYVSCVFAVHHKCFNTNVLRELWSTYFKPVHREKKKKKI